MGRLGWTSGSIQPKYLRQNFRMEDTIFNSEVNHNTGMPWPFLTVFINENSSGSIPLEVLLAFLWHFQNLSPVEIP